MNIYLFSNKTAFSFKLYAFYELPTMKNFIPDNLVQEKQM